MESIIQDKKISHRAKFCSELVTEKDIRNKSVLDIGSSDTYWMSKIFLHKKAKNVVALDPALEKEVKKDRMTSYKNDIFDKRLDTSKFHTAVIFDVLEHIPQKTELKTLKRINSLMYKNGKLFLTTPNNSLLMNVLDPAWFLGHRHYHEKDLIKLFQKAGFSIINSGVTGGLFESLRVLWLYVQKHVLKRNSFTYPGWLWYKSLEEFKNPGSMSLWIIAKKI